VTDTAHASDPTAPIRPAGDHPDSAPVTDTLTTTLDYIEAASNPAGDPRRHVPTGFEDLDELFGGGLWPGHLTVIGGRPGMGTSTLALNIAARASLDAQMATLVVCPDTSAEEINLRLLAAHAKVPLNHLRNGLMDEENWAKLTDAMGTVAGAPLWMNTTPRMTAPMVEEAVADLADRGLRLLVVDGLQSLMPAGPRESPYHEVRDTVHTLKRLARHAGIAVVVASKLTRGPEQRPDKRPLLFDLRDAGDIEDVADEVILLHREDVYERESARPGEADLIVAKHRHGPTRYVVVAFQGHYSRFVDMAR
jgi:replicative DNA helicase